MSDRWPALTLVMCAAARLDISSCSASGIPWSCVPISDHDGIVFHAGGPDGSANCAGAAGRCVANRTAASSRSTPLAKQSTKPGYVWLASQRRYRSTPPSNGTWLRALPSTQERPGAGGARAVPPGGGGKGGVERGALPLRLRGAGLVATNPP